MKKKTAFQRFLDILAGMTSEVDAAVCIHLFYRLVNGGGLSLQARNLNILHLQLDCVNLLLRPRDIWQIGCVWLADHEKTRLLVNFSRPLHSFDQCSDSGRVGRNCEIGECSMIDPCRRRICYRFSGVFSGSMYRKKCKRSGCTPPNSGNIRRRRRVLST